MPTGVVKKIDSRSGAFGTMYNAQVDGTWYGLGSKAPSFKEGDTIAFDFTQKGNFKNIDPKTVDVVPVASASGKTSSATASGSKDDYWAAKEQRDVGVQRAIQLQASRNSAIALVAPLAAAGLITLPAKDKFSAVKALVQELTDEYYLQTQEAVEGNYVPEVAPESVPFDLSQKQGKDFD